MEVRKKERNGPTLSKNPIQVAWRASPLRA